MHLICCVRHHRYCDKHQKEALSTSNSALRRVSTGVYKGYVVAFCKLCGSFTRTENDICVNGV